MSTVNVMDVVTVACAVYRINGGLVRDTKDDKVANGILVKSHFLNNTPVDITEADREAATTACNYLVQTVMLAKLTSKNVNEFTANIVELLEKETTASRNIGLLTWVPKLYADLTKNDDLKQELTVIGFGSQYLGKVGDKIIVNFTAITKRFNNNYNCWRYTGHDGNGNLVGFLSKNEIANGKIKGKIKATEYSNYNGGKTTFLNYVKEL